MTQATRRCNGTMQPVGTGQRPASLATRSQSTRSIVEVRPSGRRSVRKAPSCDPMAFAASAASVSEVGGARRAGERDDVTDILDAGHIAHRTFKAEPEAGVRH